MKKIGMALAAIVLCLIATWAIVWYGFGAGRILEGDLMAAFGADLRRFVVHNGQLPSNWAEFEEWQTRRDGHVRWRAAGSAERFEILSAPYRIVNDYPRYIAVKNPKFKGMEDYINQHIWMAYYELGKTNDMANQASEAIGANAPQPQR